MNILDSAQQRYATKKFNPAKKLNEQQLIQIKQLLRLSPSSTNAQPWHFLLSDSDSGKTRIAKAASEAPFQANAEKMINASAVVVFCHKLELDDEYQQALLDQEQAAGRFAGNDAREEMGKRRGFYIKLHQDQLKDVPQWNEKQLYLNLGNFLLAVGAMGLDAVPIEGFDSAKMDQEFALKAQGLASSVVVAIGFRADDDFNAALPKSRWPAEHIITEIE